MAMDMKQLEEKVKDIIVEELGVERDKLTNDASFMEDLGADSLDTVELVMAFEKEFDIDIPDEEAEKLRTVGQALEYLHEKMGTEAHEAARRDHGPRVRHTPGHGRTKHLGGPGRGPLGCRADHAVRPCTKSWEIRLRSEGLLTGAVARQ